MDKTGCKVICGAPTTLAVKGLMMMMMMTIFEYPSLYQISWIVNIFIIYTYFHADTKYENVGKFQSGQSCVQNGADNLT